MNTTARKLGTVYGGRVWLAAAASVVIGACDRPGAAEPDSRVFALQENLLLVELPSGRLRALKAGDGALLWEYVAPPPRRTDFGHYAAPKLECEPQRMADSGLLLAYASSTVVLDAHDGKVRWRQWQLHRPACPVATPDSGVCVPAFEAGTVGLIKLDHAGQQTWKLTLPDVGPPAAPLQSEAATGNIVVRTRTHVVSVSPAGKVNWVKPVHAVAGRLGG